MVPKNIQYSIGEVKRLFVGGDNYEPWTTREVARELECTRRTAFNKLSELEEAGEIASKQVGKGGHGGRIWWQPTESRYEDTTTNIKAVKNRITRLDLKAKDEEVLASRREAVRMAYEYLRSRRSAEASEIMKAVYDSVDGGYGSPTTLWQNCLRPGLKQMGLETPEPGKAWVFSKGDETQTGLASWASGKQTKRDRERES